MRFLILIAIVVVVFLLVKSLRKPSPPAAPSAPTPPAEPAKLEREDMVACPQCGVHLPASEALPGRGGMFCSEAHRSAYERQRGG